MANAKIEPVGPSDVGLIADLFNDIFSPARDEAFLRRRFKGRHNIAMMLAVIDDRPVGFVVGFELTPTTFFCWTCGVLSDFRRAGIATQLMQGLQAWAKDNEYQIMRFECQNQHRPIMHVAISEGYDLVGIRWDTDTANNYVIFEKDIR